MMWHVRGLNQLIDGGYRNFFPRGTGLTCDAKSIYAES
jgi:hypothetical protein